MEPDNACHSSSALEKLLEHRFVAELSTELWLRGTTDFEILRSEVDSHGYDLVIEAHGQIRHIQLKALRRDGKRSQVTLNTRLRSKPSGCVVWMVYDPATLALGPFLWLGGLPGKQLHDLGNEVARHTKGNSSGKKTDRIGHRVVKKSQFAQIPNIVALADELFGPAPFGRSRNASQSFAAIALAAEA